MIYFEISLKYLWSFRLILIDKFVVMKLFYKKQTSYLTDKTKLKK